MPAQAWGLSKGRHTSHRCWHTGCRVRATAWSYSSSPGILYFSVGAWLANGFCWSLPCTRHTILRASVSVRAWGCAHARACVSVCCIGCWSLFGQKPIYLPSPCVWARLEFSPGYARTSGTATRAQL
eukprot:7131355-Prymnesium_polylepis.1